MIELKLTIIRNQQMDKNYHDLEHFLTVTYTSLQLLTEMCDTLSSKCQIMILLFFYFEGEPVSDVNLQQETTTMGIHSLFTM